MDRPTCKTCPYWNTLEDEDEPEPLEGWCHRFPPLPAVTKVMIKETGMYDGIHVVTRRCDFCGEHPDFPAYIAGPKGPTGNSFPLNHATDQP